MDILALDAAEYFLENLTLDEVVSVKFLWNKIDEAPRHIRRYIKKTFRNVEQFEDFLSMNPNFFNVQDGRVTHVDSVFGYGSIDAIEYFEDTLRNYYADNNPHYKNLRGHVGQAPENARAFINNLYRGRRFKVFLESHPDTFIVFPDGTVSLVEDESVNYFEDVMEDYGEGENYMNLRGHIGQAPKHVQEFINEYYPGKEFLDFLRKNNDVFQLDDEAVYLY